MKRIFTLIAALSLSAISFAQTISRTASTVSQLPVPGGRAWSVGPTRSTVSLSNGNPESDYLVIKGFDFSTLPTNIVVNSLNVTITRKSEPTAGDRDVRLVLGGTVLSAANTNAASSPTVWPAAFTANTYNFGPAAYGALTTSDLQNANFGIAIAALRSAGIVEANVENAVTITLNYSILAPLILTDFSVSKNADNHVAIRFSTATEDNVQYIYIERSTDGKNFEKIFTITPKGARNVYTSYALTDKTPVQGNNYYRITEVDKNGRWFYYMTKLVNITKKGSAFNAYYNGGQVVANISNTPGQYEVALVDMSGITISRKAIVMNGSSAQVALDAPSRTGVYLVIMKSQGMSLTTRVAVMK
jgi:hypothetical protein